MAVTARHYDTILSPVITEKATYLSEQNKVVFQVAKDAFNRSISSSARTAGWPLKLINRMIPGRDRIRVLSARSILTNTYPGKSGRSTSTRR